MKTLVELRKLDTKELREEGHLTRKELFKIEFEVRNGQSKSNHEIDNHRKQIARIETLLNEKTAAESAAA